MLAKVFKQTSKKQVVTGYRRLQKKIAVQNVDLRPQSTPPPHIEPIHVNPNKSIMCIGKITLLSTACFKHIFHV